jgi:chromosome segregation ATPase
MSILNIAIFLLILILILIICLIIINSMQFSYKKGENYYTGGGKGDKGSLAYRSYSSQSTSAFGKSTKQRSSENIQSVIREANRVLQLEYDDDESDEANIIEKIQELQYKIAQKDIQIRNLEQESKEHIIKDEEYSRETSKLLLELDNNRNEIDKLNKLNDLNDLNEQQILELERKNKQLEQIMDLNISKIKEQENNIISLNGKISNLQEEKSNLNRELYRYIGIIKRLTSKIQNDHDRRLQINNHIKQALQMK